MYRSKTTVVFVAIGDEQNINMSTTKSPEFDGWRWVSFWYPVRQVISFKKEVYRKVMKEFAAVLFTNKSSIERKSEATQRKKTNLPREYSSQNFNYSSHKSRE